MENVKVYNVIFVQNASKVSHQKDVQVNFNMSSFKTIFSKKYHHSRAWIQDKIHHYSPKVNTRKVRAVTVVIDATYFGKKKIN